MSANVNKKSQLAKNWQVERNIIRTSASIRFWVKYGGKLSTIICLFPMIDISSILSPLIPKTWIYYILIRLKQVIGSQYTMMLVWSAQ